MLEGLRIASQHRIGRIILGLVMGFIALSFAVWGIGDVFRGFTSTRLAKVGSGEISIEAYRSAYQNELRRLQQRARRAITNEEARRFGLDQQVLQRMITDLSLDQKTKALGLAISEDETLRLTRDENVFKGPTGKFDSDRFKQLIRDAGYTERSFLLEQKGSYLRKTLTDSIVSGLEPPRLVLEALHRFRNEIREVDYFLLPASAVGEVAKPSEEELKKYFADREQSFRAREYRKLALLTVTPASLAEPQKVAEADVRKLYDEVKAKRYGTAEKRHLRQILFASKDEAEKALERLKGGLSFDALAGERKLSQKDIDLGLLEAHDLGDKQIAEKVFSSREPGFVGPIQTAFGAAILQVEKIIPSVFTRSYEEAADELRREIAQGRSAPSVRKLHDAIEDQRTGGKTLAEAAKAAGLDVVTIEAVDSTGLDPAGKNVPGLFGSEDLLKAVFASDVGVDNDTVPTRDGGYVWFEIAKVEPARQRSFDEVKEAVETALRGEKQQKALTERAEALTTELRGGKAIEDVAKGAGAEVRHVGDVKRAPHPELTTAAIVAIFEAPPKGAGSAAVDGGRLVFEVKSASTPAYDPASLEAKAAADQLRPAFTNDILEQYVGALEKVYSVSINEQALQAATGGAEKNP
ncbi:peptidylprolyl isomerase [Methylosinus sp. C49]|uniref:SurA N-terminal domain-containing protein n=1 Tax=Methylosinus sp. C49 TaxID=2699395 RepID=UPI001366D68B|nr:SurA N-terminal domain-containing protein [Methylosinus sp. C49]BBU63045.1 peptidylprolyl isomerase [Methylosinus sp. C49]